MTRTILLALLLSAPGSAAAQQIDPVALMAMATRAVQDTLHAHGDAAIVAGPTRAMAGARARAALAQRLGAADVATTPSVQCGSRCLTSPAHDFFAVSEPGFGGSEAEVLVEVWQRTDSPRGDLYRTLWRVTLSRAEGSWRVKSVGLEEVS